jgi:hypothetical protein
MLLDNILANAPWDQIFPLLFVFIIVPSLTIGIYNRPRTRWLATMVFENLGQGLWAWINGYGAQNAGKVARKKPMRRADHKDEIEGTLCISQWYIEHSKLMRPSAGRQQRWAILPRGRKYIRDLLFHELNATGLISLF